MSFIDISGMNLAQQRLNVISNNIANANTVGFKAATFNQTLASMSFVSSAGTLAPGAVQGFSQGTVSTSTGGSLNMAITGTGLFQLQGSNGMTYTRDGQFSLNKDGNIVGAMGDFLTGYNAVNGVIPTSGTAVPLTINTTASKPVATTTATLGLTLNSANPVINRTAIIGPPAIAATPFSPTNSASYHDTTTSTVYDALGASHIVQTFYTKTADVAGVATWDVNAIVDPSITPVTPVPVGTLTFNSSGQLTSSGLFPGAVTVGTGSVSLDLSQSVQYASSFGATASQDGFKSGQLTGYSVDIDGTVSAQYGTGNSVVMGKVLLATFRNLNGLAPAPNNQWTATSASGVANIGSPDSTALGLGQLTSSAIEDSNVNLVNEMVNMISAQRAFQAQSSVIKTEDQNLQTIVALKQ